MRIEGGTVLAEFFFVLLEEEFGILLKKFRDM